MTTPYSLATIRHQGAPLPVIEVGGHYWSITDVAPGLIDGTHGKGLLDLFADWPAANAKLGEVAGLLQKQGHPGELPTPSRPEDFCAPLLYPSKLIMMGFNYADHISQDGGIQGFNKNESLPTLFMKPPTTAMVGGGPSVPYPVQTQKFDWEIELAAVIGTKARKVSAKASLSYVAGYTIGIDLSARDWQMNQKNIIKMDLFGGKAFDNSNPLGPRIVPAAFLNPSDLELILRVNGEVKQRARTCQMIWSIAEQIEAISKHVTLEPGDILMTGTPSGVGLSSNTYLKAGDRIDAVIEGLGCLTVEITEALQ